VYELARDTLRQLTFDPANDYQPVWTPDGRRIVFGSDRARTGTNNLYWVNADGTGEVTRLTESSETQYATSWDPSGRFLAFVATRPGTANDLMILPMKGDTAATLTPGTPTVFLGTPKTEFDPQFSPDGRFIAYLSREGTGVSDLYVRPFPGPGGPWRVSAGFASFPRWSPRGHELLFTAQDKIMFAPYVVQGDSFRADKPRVWSPTSIWRGAAPSYDIHPDGERVAAAALEGGDAAQDKLVFVFNFFDYLKKIAPTKKP
jgi:serine/threonine-protein kinase